MLEIGETTKGKYFVLAHDLNYMLKIIEGQERICFVEDDIVKLVYEYDKIH